MWISVLVVNLHGHFARNGMTLIPTALATLVTSPIEDVVADCLGQLKLLASYPAELTRLPSLYGLGVLPLVLAFGRAVKGWASGVTLPWSN